MLLRERGWMGSDSGEQSAVQKKTAQDSEARVEERLSPLKEKLPDEAKEDVEQVPEEDVATAESDADLEPPPPESEELPPEEAWLEEFEEEIIEPEKPVKRKKRRRGYGKFIVLAIVLIILLAWTVLSPDVMPQVGDVYTASEAYANLGNFTGYRDMWAGNMTWGLSIRGPNSTQAGGELDIYVLITKVYEDPGNPFFKGTWFTLENVSVFLDDGSDEGVYLASMANYTSLDYGMDAMVPLTFSVAGSYDLMVHAKITVYMDMWIGFLPLESVNMNRVFLDEPIVVY